VRGLDYYTRTVFEIVSITEKEDTAVDDDEKNKDGEKKDSEDKSKEKEEKKAEEMLSLGSGGRYDDLAHALGSRRDVPAVGAAIGVDRAIKAPGFLASQPRIIKKPKVHFIQIGTAAKFKSFEAIEVLRKARIPITHAISKDTLSAQLGMAEKAKITYIVILGQKEANENSVIVRNMNTRSQETVPISKLGDYLKKRS
jgi:histidyl-tRNA synthetase